MHCRCYIGHEFLGYPFSLHSGNVDRPFKILGPMALKKIKIENKFRELKIFKILSETYRNHMKKLNLRFNPRIPHTLVRGIRGLKLRL